MSRVCILQHIAIETPGLIADALKAAGCQTADRHVAEWVTTFAEEVHQAGVDARAILAGAKQQLPTLQRIGTSVFSRWAALVNSER